MMHVPGVLKDCFRSSGTQPREHRGVGWRCGYTRRKEETASGRPDCLEKFAVTVRVMFQDQPEKTIRKERAAVGARTKRMGGDGRLPASGTAPELPWILFGPPLLRIS